MSQASPSRLFIEYEFTRSEIHDILADTYDIKNIDTLEKYKALHKLRHDVIHEAICIDLGIEFGERPVSEFFEPAELEPYYKYLHKQTPDIIIKSGKDVKIIEITISENDDAYSRKVIKYSLLVKTLERSGYSVDYKVFVMPISINSRSLILLSNTIGVDPDAMIIARKNMLQINSMLNRIKVTPLGREFDKNYDRPMLVDHDLGMTPEKVLDLHTSSERKCFVKDDDLADILSTDPKVDKDFDDSILEFICDSIPPDIKTMFGDQKPDVEKIMSFHRKSKNDLGKKYILTIPPVSLNGVDSSIRSTELDDTLVRQLKANCLRAQDPFLQSLGAMINHEGECIGKLKLSSELRFSIALHGPGRKSYVRSGSEPHIAAQKKHTSFYADIDLETTEIEKTLWMLSKKSRTNSLDDPVNLRGFGLDYVKMCQAIYREVNINSLRKDLNRNFIVKPTGIHGVFVIIHKGPKLKVGVGGGLVWFKVCGYTEQLNLDAGEGLGLFRDVHYDGPIWHTGWTSTDSKRLTHYIRCYDRIIMSYLSFLSQTTNKTLVSAYNDDGSNTLGTIIMLYMEDKRCTSKMLQDVRYFAMGLLSEKQYWKEVLEKFCEPLRSDLQSYMLKKILKIAASHQSWVSQMLRSSQFPKFQIDPLTGSVENTRSAYYIMCPRILTDGPMINFQQLLHEMYFCMLFNKDQDDPTHASFQILTKIIEGDNSLEEVKSSTKLHVGYTSDSTIQDDILTLIKQPHKNQFSRFVVELASRLQSKSQSCTKPDGLAHQNAAFDPSINKTIDEFATFKSSATFNHSTYPKEFEGFMVNPRIRCLSGVLSLLNENLTTTFDVVRAKGHLPTRFQVFKKNQVGGVREILVLDIASRIKINMIESHSRKICESDAREMLTHGKTKQSRFIETQHVIRETPGRNTVFHYNFDKTRWGPSFMPIQFLYMYTPFRNQYPELFRSIAYILIQHTNKECYYPDHLLRAWMSPDGNKSKGEGFPLLDPHRDRFISSRSLSFINESNMGQGILHYISSHYHLCVVSLRDEIYKRLCKRRGLNPGKWSDLISSDDSYTCHAIPSDGKTYDSLRTFMEAQEVSERLMNVWTSRSKSSISRLVGEFNSTFISGMGVMPVTIKFALTSVDPFETDSFVDMVQASYNSSRQLFENGGGLELYEIAQKLNKDYCESIYHSKPGLENDPSAIFSLPRDQIPYQFGVFPMAPPTAMIMVGPECHNLKIADGYTIEGLDRRIQTLMSKAYTLVESTDLEVVADTMSMEDVMNGVRPVNAITKPNKRLIKLRSETGTNYDSLMDKIVNDPTIILRRPRDHDEVVFKTRIKLYQSSAIDAMKITDGSLYYGRVSASVSAKAFRVSGYDSGLKTYKDCLLDIRDRDPDDNVNVMPFTLSYRIGEYREIIKLSALTFELTFRHQLEPRTYHQSLISEMKMQMAHPMSDVLNYFWNSNLKEYRTSYERDLAILQAKVPMIKESLESTLDQFSGSERDRISKLCLLLMRLMSSSDSQIKGFFYGAPSKFYEQTAITFTRQNFFNSMTARTNTSEVLVTSHLDDFYVMKMWLNYFIYCKANEIDDDDRIRQNLDVMMIRRYCTGPRLPSAEKKRFMFMLSYFNLIEDTRWWTKNTGTIITRWIKEQRQVGGRWVGEFELLCSTGSTVVHASGNNEHINLTTNAVSDMQGLTDIIININRMFSIPINKMKQIYGEGEYLMMDSVLHREKSEISFNISTALLDVPGISGYKIDCVKDQLQLIGEDNRIVLSVPIAFGPVDSTSLDFPDDIKMFGMNVRHLINIGAFGSLFTIHGIRESDLKDCLTDVKVNPEPTYDWNADQSLVEDSYIDFNLEEMGEMMQRAYDVESDDSKDDDESSGDVDEMVDYEQIELDNQVSRLISLIDLDTDHLNPFKPKIRSDKRGAIIYERIKSLQYLIIAFVLCGKSFNASAKIITLAERIGLPKLAIDSLTYVNKLRMSHTDVVIPNANLTIPEWLIDMLEKEGLR